MRFRTARNLLLSMVVLGLAGSAVGIGTFAQFNAVTTSQNNTFSSASITLSSTNNGGTCTSTSGASATGSCTGNASYTIQGSTLVAGDSKTVTTTLTNGGNVSVKVDLAITDTAGVADNIVTANIGSAGSTAAAAAGLGLLILECRDSGHLDIACNSVNVAELYTVYGSCGTSGSSNAAAFATVTQAGAFSSSNVTTNNGLGDNGIKVGTGTNGYCYGGNTAAGIKGLSVPIVALSSNPTAGNASPLASTKTDNLAIIVYLPATANNTDQANTDPNLTLTWTATQIAGSAS